MDKKYYLTKFSYPLVPNKRRSKETKWMEKLLDYFGIYGIDLIARGEKCTPESPKIG